MPMRIKSGVNKERFSDFGKLNSNRKQLNWLVAMPERMGFNAYKARFIFPLVQLLNLISSSLRVNKYPSEKSIRIVCYGLEYGLVFGIWIKMENACGEFYVTFRRKIGSKNFCQKTKGTVC